MPITLSKMSPARLLVDPGPMIVILLRRLLVLAAFAFWQGGFTFYAAVVVPVGTEVLGSSMEQGSITRRVTVYLNMAGAKRAATVR